jgi:septum formation protein
MMPLILASASPRRFELLSQLEVPFTVVPADVDEHEGDDLDPREMVLLNARMKGTAVAARFPQQVVLAADTTVFIDDCILNKPLDLDDAWRMLHLLSGRTHSVFTGLFLKGPDAPFELEFGVESRVTFKRLDDEIIRNYFQKVNPLDKAGGYAIQESGEMIIAGHEGSLSNIIGLPVEETRTALQKFGFLQE